MKIFSVEVDDETLGSIRQVARVPHTLILGKAVADFSLCIYSLPMVVFLFFFVSLGRCYNSLICAFNVVVSVV